MNSGTIFAFSEFSNGFLQHNSSFTPPASTSPSIPTAPPVLSSQVAASTPVPAAPLIVPAPLAVSLPVATLITPYTSVDTRVAAAPSVPDTVNTHVAAPTDTIATPTAPQSVMPEFPPPAASILDVPAPSSPVSAASSQSTQANSIASHASSNTTSQLPGELHIDLPIAPQLLALVTSITNVHPMLTKKQARDQHGMVALLDTDTTKPKTVKSTIQSPHWFAAMCDELTSLKQNNTWELVPRQAKMNVVGSRWVFKTKLKSDGSV